jgi:hypothetical protein
MTASSCPILLGSSLWKVSSSLKRIWYLLSFYILKHSPPKEHFKCRVAHQLWFNADADPAFFLIADPDPVQNPGFWLSIIQRNLQLEFFLKLQFTYPWSYIKDSQVREAFRPQKRTSSTSKHEIIYFFLFLYVIYALLDTDPHFECGSIINSNKCGSIRIRMRIWIRSPKPCLKVWGFSAQ